MFGFRMTFILRFECGHIYCYCKQKRVLFLQNFEQKMLKKGGSWIQKTNITEKNWYPRQKVSYAKRKLAGANPAVITW